MAASTAEPAATQAQTANGTRHYQTKVLPVSVSDLGTFQHTVPGSFLHEWSLSAADTDSGRNLTEAANQLRNATSPVAFPTETVYGLAADATSSQAVRGIYRAKNRPADNPLIVHFCHLEQLRKLLDPTWDSKNKANTEICPSDPIPGIYHELLFRFWPGPLTIILPLPTPSPLAPEVSNSLKTFGARIPASTLALALIQQVDRPLAGPSANASTKPSTTTAQHVLEDMDGRIELILDGGLCNYGVESTVVDGLSNPPCVLRPGGVSIGEIRRCNGWENVVNGYRQTERNQKGSKPGTADNGKASKSHETDTDIETNNNEHDAPRAPGMKYRHYAPRAAVVLLESPAWHKLPNLIEGFRTQSGGSVGIISTSAPSGFEGAIQVAEEQGLSGPLSLEPVPRGSRRTFEAFIGPTIADVSRNLFRVLRELDSRNVEVIYVEGCESEKAEAVMNRVRKAAETIIGE